MATATASRPKKAPKPKKAWGTSRPKAKARPRAYGGAKTGVSIKHTCGHTQKHPLKGKKWQKDREKLHQAGRICTTCWALGRADELEAACNLPEWPIMDGTEAMVLWARSIRALAIVAVQGEAAVMDRERKGKGLPPAAEEFLSIALPPMLKEVKARWWIDYRDEKDRFLELLLDFDSQDALEALRKEASLVPDLPF